MAIGFPMNKLNSLKSIYFSSICNRNGDLLISAAVMISSLDSIAFCFIGGLFERFTRSIDCYLSLLSSSKLRLIAEQRRLRLNNRSTKWSQLV